MPGTWTGGGPYDVIDKTPEPDPMPEDDADAKADGPPQPSRFGLKGFLAEFLVEFLAALGWCVRRGEIKRRIGARCICRRLDQPRSHNCRREPRLAVIGFADEQFFKVVRPRRRLLRAQRSRKTIVFQSHLPQAPMLTFKEDDSTHKFKGLCRK